MNTRKATFPINDMILNRWSPRAMSPDELMPEEELMTLFEAARWAPSSYNGQPWRFIYAQRGTKDWDHFFDLLVPFNQSWAKNATYLFLVISRDTFAWNNEFSRTHSFDTGAACENLAIQGHIDDIVVHAMEGFDYDRAKKVGNVPDEYTIEAMFAVGKPGNKENLPEELQERETLSDRKPLNELVFAGTFKKKEV